MFKIVEVRAGDLLPGTAGKVEDWEYRHDLASYYEEFCTLGGEWYGREREFNVLNNYDRQGYEREVDGGFRLTGKGVVLVAIEEPEINEFGEVCP